MVDKLREVYESDPLAMASAYGVEAVDPEETVQAAKDVAQFGWESLPGVGTYYTVQDITEELEQESPNYMRIGMLAGTEVIGLIPGIGDAAANLIRKGAKFKTKRGSVYTVEDESRTTRERAPDTPDGEFVKQPTSGKTIYMSYEDMERFGPLFQKGEPGLYQFRPSGEGKAQLVFTKDYGPYKAGDPVPDTEVSFTLEPELGMNPVEIYDSTNNARTSIHFGNEIVEVESDIPKVPRDKEPLDIAGNPQLDNAEYAEKMASFDVEDDMETWKKNIKQYIADNRDVDPVVRTYPLEEAAQRFLDKEITREEYLKYIDEYKPVTAWDQLPREPSTKAMVYSLKPNQIERGSFVLSPEEAANLGVKESSLSVGDFFDGRLDVTAYKEFDTWIVAGAKTGEKGQHYAKAVHYEGGDGNPVILLNSDNPKKYETNIKTGERIGAAQQNPRGETYGKTPYAAISGYVKDLDVENIRKQAEQLLNDPEWVQLGFDPRRQGNFYVRSEKPNAPLHAVATSAEEVIQIGPLVLAKNPVLDLDYEGYNEGGMAMDEQMNAVFKSRRTNLDAVPDNTVGVDPESGNEIPLGSLPEEVRDDIPAQLSEGEYVVPADVVRYYGVKFFEDLRAEAKFGYQDMEQNGRIGGEPPMGMEMIEPEDDMMFDISELEVMEVPDEPEGAFFGKLFGKKEEKSPEETVRDRFDAVSKREKLKREAHQRAVEMANKDDGGPSIAEQINFGGDYEDTSSSSSSSGSKSKPKKESAASRTVRRAYTGAQEDDGQTFAEKINFGGKYNNGGYALNPGDEGYDEMGSLGLGSEGVGLGSDVREGSVIEMVAYVNEEGRVIYILHIDGVPQNEVPAGFYIRTEEESATEEDATEAQPEAQVVAQSDDDGGPDTPMPEAIDYKNLTTDEMEDLLNDITDPKNKAIMLGISAMMGPAGLLVKGAMMHQESQLRKEMERRLGGELTSQERERIETMYQQIEKKKGGIFGSLTGKVADLVIGEEQGPGMDIQPPKTYTPETTAGDVTTPETPTPESIITTTELPDMSPFRDAGAEAGAAARKKVLEGKAVSTPSKMINQEYDEDQGRLSTQNQIFEARSRAREGTQDVLKTMRDRGAGRTERSAAVKEGARVESVMADQARGIKRGFKKGGLASKKKKK